MILARREICPIVKAPGFFFNALALAPLIPRQSDICAGVMSHHLVAASAAIAVSIHILFYESDIHWDTPALTAV